VDAHSLLDCDVSGMCGATVVRPVGVLDIHTYPLLRDCLLKCAADQPRAVIVDLEALEIAHDVLVSVFVTVWMRVSQWSTVPLMLVPAPAHAALFGKSPARRFVTVHATVQTALDRADEPPPRLRTELWLPPSVRSVLASARFVADTCHNWAVEVLTADAVVVANELVANAAAHTTWPATLRLELWHRRLTVAVADDDPRPVVLPRPDRTSGDSRGGLLRVARLARAAGCSRRQSGGKVVWAVLRVPS
jgi:anti-anti-sigma regulatory factor